MTNYICDFKRFITPASVIFLFIYLFMYKSPVFAGLLENKETLLDGVGERYNSKQIIVVSTEKESDYMAKLCTFEKVNGQWKQAFPEMTAMIGMKGITQNKVEGDKKSPAGIFEISEAFGTAAKPINLKLSYTKTTKSDFWIDDEASNDYNKLMHFEGDPYRRWNSFERLNLECYKYVIVLNYNREPVIKGKGSAIFLHKFSGQKTGSLGCTEVSEDNLVKILNWIDIGKKPVIIQGTNVFINSTLESLRKVIRVELDGKELNFDVSPRIIKGRTLVPVRSIFEALGLELKWDSKSRTVTGKKEGNTITIKVDKEDAFVNGNKTILDMPAQIIDNRILVPLRFVSECFGAHTDWDSKSRTVLIETK